MSLEESATPEQMHQLLDAVISVSADLELSAVLHKVVVAATKLVDARYGALGVLDERREHLAEFLTVGMDDDAEAAIGERPKGKGVLGLLIVDAAPVRLERLADHPLAHGVPPGHPTMTTFLGVPIHVRDQVFGNLYLTDKEGGSAFTETDEALVVALAAAAGIAIENARLHGRIGALRVFEDRERIARDLHDTVIQRLFATGLTLSRVAGAIEEPELRDRLEGAVDDLDRTVREIRSTIFDLHRRHLPGHSIRQDVLELVSEAAETLGFRPTVTFEGAIDLSVPDDLAANVLATLREALANMARHAKASHGEVALTIDDGRLELRVTDDGVGLPDAGRPGGHGLRNLAERAEEHGGSFTAATRPAGGTELRWSVVLPQR